MIFSTRGHEKLKKVAIFRKKREKHENHYFFAKIGKTVPNMDFNKHLGGIHKFDQLDFLIFNFSHFYGPKGCQFGQKIDFWSFFFEKMLVFSAFAKNEENPFHRNLVSITY